MFKLTFFGEFSLTSFAYFDILNLRLTERNYPAKSSQGKKKESQKKKGKDNEKNGTWIRKGDKIGQFRIMEVMPEIEFEEVESFGNSDRGGFGTTGAK